VIVSSVLVAAFAAAAQAPVTLAAPPTNGVNAHYVGRRAPLAPEPLLKLPIGAVRPRGWLAHKIDAMASGMFGRLPEVSHWCRPEGSAWRSKDGRGENGWEELPYWLKGFTSLALLVDGGDPTGVSADPKLRELARDWIEAILASQRDDGYFGPESNRAQPDLWPNMPVLAAMRTWHEATGDPRVLEFLTKYFRFELALPDARLLPDSWQKVRGGDNLEIVHWLYDRTGEAWLLDLAKRLHERTADWTGGVASLHGVNFCQGFREPMQFFAQSRDVKHRDATLRDYAEVMARFGQVPGGMFGADENARDGCGDPRQAAEACSMVEFMASFELLGAQTGDVVWFDRCEDVAFNSLPAATTELESALHYLTSPNLASCDAADHSPGVQNDGCMFAFSPDERYRCCQHNVVQGWPWFVEHLWFATRDGGLACALLAPCDVKAKVADGVDAEVEVQTDYPFGDAIEWKLRCSKPVRFPLYLRVPAWCDAPDALHVVIDNEPDTVTSAAGQFVRIERDWSTFNHLKLTLPMTARVRRFPGNHDSVAIDRGPLTWSLDLGEQPVDLDATGGDECGEPEWRTTALVATRPWNYGLDRASVDGAARLEYVPPDSSGSMDATTHMRTWAPYEPFAHDGAPRLLAKVRRIPEWRLDWTGLVAPLQSSPVASSAPVETVALLPMGCAHLRISAFPVVASAEDVAAGRAHAWAEPKTPPRASHVHDDPFALDDGIVPKNSIDLSVPRFTFWDHCGSVEWVQYDFPQRRNVSRSGVYWFDDTGVGRCRVPKSWRLLWLDGVTWREVAKPSAYSVERDRMNEVAFTPVATRSLRLEVTLQPEFSGGMFEWTVGE
jgi:hypothetical protein